MNNDYDTVHPEPLSSELACPDEISSLSNWFFKFVFDITPKSVLSSAPSDEEMGVNKEPVRELAGELDTGSVGGSDLSVSISPWTASRK